jgi:outer membrane receptor for ferric coprogen and ferric-rhodotorulic acid
MSTKFSLFLGSAAAMAVTPAMAQTAEEAPGRDEEIVVTGTYTLPDKIDTATGLGLTVRETPQSVSIMTAQRILDQNLISAADVLTNSVGVSVNELDDTRNEFFARGFQIRNTQIDGVPVTWDLAGSRGETNIDVSVYERVEIVRGATGLLSGAGDPSASVNFVRKHASSHDLTGYLNASYGSWDTWRLSGDVGGDVTSDGTLRFRAVGRYEKGESFVDLYKNEKFVLYGTIEGDVTETTLLRAGIVHQKNMPDGHAWGNLPTFYSDGTLTDWPRSKAATADWSYWNTTNQNVFVTLQQEIGDDWSIVANYNRLKNTERAKLLYLSGTVDVDTGFIQYSFPYKDAGQSIQDSYDAQIKGKLRLFGRDHELVLGALHSIQNRYTDSYAALSFPAAPDYVNFDGTLYPDPGFSNTPSHDLDERLTQTGFYGALRVNVSDALKLIGGGRIASWKQTGVSYTVVSDYGDDNVFIPYVGALYDITPHHRLYASFTKIFQPQDALDRTFRQLEPLQGNAYEIGLKSAFFDEKLQASLALFRIEQDNVAAFDIQLPRPGDGMIVDTFRAVQGATSKGFEVEVTGSPMENWNLNLSYSQFKIEDADGGAINTNQPRKLLKLFTTYTVPDVLHGLTFGGGVNYRSKAYSAGSNTVTGAPFRFQQDGYVLVSLMTRLAVTERLELQGNIENLLDKTYYAQMGFYDQYRYGAPRNFTVGASYKF